MLRIKKLDIFIVKSFTLLFVGTFFICLFIFMMQFLWRYIDELVGKGLEISVLGQFFFYSGLTLVPLSLPLAILLASLITFGNFGERYELLAMKAAGISLLKIMTPLIFFIGFIVCMSFFFQNIITPKAQVKLYTLIYSMKQKSPELDIPEGVFYDEISNYNLYVKHKDRKTGMLYDVMIYNFSDGFDNAHIVVADSGKLEMTADQKHLYLRLYSGEQFENLKSQTAASNNVPYRRESFREKHSIIEFDSEFSMADASFMNDQSISKNITQLQASIDSLQTRGDSIGRQFFNDAMNSAFRPVNLSKTDSTKLEEAKTTTFINVDSLFRVATLLQKQRTITTALNRSENQSNDWSFKSFGTKANDDSLRKHKTEWHNKITLSVACLIFFFIGAPLGAIIRKGGLGMPVVVSVLIFIIYYIINNTGYKMARDGNWEVWIGMWTSTAVLAPLGAFLTYKSNNDSVVLNADAYINWFRKVAGIRSVRHIARKEVIIHDPAYNETLVELDKLCRLCETYMNEHSLLKAPNYIKLWIKDSGDKDIIAINDKLEELVEELSNSKSSGVINTLNYYPILAVHAHRTPFNIPALNYAAGVILPVGLLFYFRIWIFRIRLNKDLKQIIKTSRDLQYIIKKQNI